LKVALDATYSLEDAPTGVGVYSREILFGLARAHPERRFDFYYRPHRFARALGVAVPANCRRRLLQAPFGPWGVMVFHALNQRLPGFGPRYTVATFHDLFVIAGDYSTAEFRARFSRQAREAARADAIITVSAFTASQVETLLGVEPGRIHVIHHGTRARPVADAARRNMVLHVGAIQKRKNVARLVEAFERMPPDWELVLAGGSGYEAAKIHDRIRRSPRRSSIRVLGYAGEAQLTHLFATARIFAFPSLDEGFGMPVLDAMAAGLPVLTSNRSALPEVAGDAALLVDPLDGDAIADGLLRLASDHTFWGELQQRGRRRAAEFTWENSVEKTWAVYKTLAAI
jgi:glycosyltransferase involved in cell wall biosynthesis